MFDETHIAYRQTVTGLVGAYKQACDEIDQAYDLLLTAQKRLTVAFGEKNTSFNTTETHDYHSVGPAMAVRVKVNIRKQAWRVIIDALEIKKIMSKKAIDDLDARMESKDAPEITIETVFEIVETLRQNSREYAKELSIEVYNYLMRGLYIAPYKTNVKNARRSLGKKVIIESCLRHYSTGGGMEVTSYSETILISVDKVFYSLDGRGVPGGYKSPLVDAINTSKAAMRGETEFFSFKCYENGNLHLTFKRVDLVERLNQIAGGKGRLGD